MKMLEEQFGKMPGAKAKAPITTYEKMGKTKEVGGYKTEGYQMMKGGEKVGEMWVATLKELGLSKKDIQIFSKMVHFFEEATKGSPFMDKEFHKFRMMDPTSKDFVGFPLSMTDDDGDVTLVTSIEKGPVDPSVFDIN